jgi:hypothetical protein
MLIVLGHPIALNAVRICRAQRFFDRIFALEQMRKFTLAKQTRDGRCY